MTRSLCDTFGADAGFHGELMSWSIMFSGEQIVAKTRTITAEALRLGEAREKGVP